MLVMRRRTRRKVMGVRGEGLGLGLLLHLCLGVRLRGQFCLGCAGRMRDGLGFGVS